MVTLFVICAGAVVKTAERVISSGFFTIHLPHHSRFLALNILLLARLQRRGRLNIGYGFGYGAEASSKMTFIPVSVSANVVSAKFPLRP